MSMRLRDIASGLGLEFEGDGDLEIKGVAPLGKAAEGDLSFLADPNYASELKTTKASAVIVAAGVDTPCRGVIRSPNPYFTFATIVSMFAPRHEIPSGIADSAYIDETAEVAASASVMANVYIAPGAKVGENTKLYPGVYIGHGASVGDDCQIYPNVVIRDGVRVGNRVIMHPGSVLGADGFGFVTVDGIHHKIPQVGRVIIEDDVEIGANSSVDRGALGDTIVGRGTKIDNLVMIGHNVKVGEHCIIVAQVGISGSTQLGHHVVMAGQSGIVGHIKVGDLVRVGAQSGVISHLKSGGEYTGMPAIPHKDWLRSTAIFKKLPEMKKELAELKKRVAELEGGNK